MLGSIDQLTNLQQNIDDNIDYLEEKQLPLHYLFKPIKKDIPFYDHLNIKTSAKEPKFAHEFVKQDYKITWEGTFHVGFLYEVMTKQKLLNEKNQINKNVDLVKGKDDKLCYENCKTKVSSLRDDIEKIEGGKGRLYLKGEISFKNTDGFLSAELRSYK